MAMRPSSYTDRNPDLPHQVVFLAQKKGSDIVVSCNCRSNGHSYDSMGKTLNLEESRLLYNDPANHDKPFGPEDEAKW